jgi:hypothetical protein
MYRAVGSFRTFPGVTVAAANSLDCLEVFALKSEVPDTMGEQLIQNQLYCDGRGSEDGGPAVESQARNGASGE